MKYDLLVLLLCNVMKLTQITNHIKSLTSFEQIKEAEKKYFQHIRYHRGAVSVETKHMGHVIIYESHETIDHGCPGDCSNEVIDDN